MKKIYERRIKNLRIDHDLKQSDVAEILGTSQTMYARYERGANELPIRHLMKLCEYYNVSADYILGYSNYRPLFDQQNQTKKKTSFVITRK